MLLPAIAALITISLFTSCEKIKGKGEVITETRTTGTYSSIGLSMSATVYYTQGTGYSLLVRGQENVLREIVTEVEGNELVIRVKKNVILGTHEPVSVYITAPTVTGLNVSGSGDFYSDSPWIASTIALNISGSGNINMGTVECETLSATISGSGSIRAAGGTATREELRISGSGTIDLRSLPAVNVYTTTSGSGDTYTHATNLLDVTISGSGDIWYYGTPAINTHISGSGNLHKM